MASPDDDDDELLSAAESLAQLERLSRLMRAAGHHKGLNPAQWEALRYVSRANVQSNSPGALARYLGATKGTVSQTVHALQRKGLISKLARSQDGRSVSLALTEAGRAMLAEDQLLALAPEIERLGRKTRRRFDRAVAGLLAAETRRQKEPSFGTCITCRSYREGRGDTPAQCTRFNAMLQPGETGQICIEHEARQA